MISAEERAKNAEAELDAPRAAVPILDPETVVAMVEALVARAKRAEKAEEGSDREP